MVKMMKKIIVGLFFVSTVMAANSFAQGLDIKIEDKSLKIGADIKAVAVLSNKEDKEVEWVFESYMRSSNPKAPTPRGYSKAITLKPGEEKSIEFSFNTKWLVYSGEYTLVSNIINKENKSIAKLEHTISVVGGLQHMDVKPILCADKECKKMSKLFTEGATIFINYKSNVDNPKVSVNITLPDKSEIQKDLPTELSLKQAGDYLVKSVASKEGYKTDYDTVMFAVVSSTKDEYGNMLKMQGE